MADTDIYKNREAMPLGNKPEKKKRRRRAASQRAFDDKARKRRSKNSGLRRFLHLSRKSENEKVFWTVMGSLLLGIVLAVAVWQFIITEQRVLKQEQEAQDFEYQPHIPENTPDGSKESIL